MLSLFSTSTSLDTAIVKVRVSLGTVGATVSTDDSESGNALMLIITNPNGPRVEVTSCFAERATGWLGRNRVRFALPLHGIPFQFGEDGDECLAWTEITSLTSLKDVVQLYVRDSHGAEWPVENIETWFDIRDRLSRRPRLTSARH